MSDVFHADCGAVTFEHFHARAADTSTPRRFKVQLYNGGELPFPHLELPVVFDLATLVTASTLVANLDHDPRRRVGVFTVVNDGRKLVADVIANAATPYRDEVVRSAESGFTWQASLEASRGQMERIAAGKSVSVNGRTFVGPLMVSRGAELMGLGFVTYGLDRHTSVSLAAGNAVENFPYALEYNENRAAYLAAGVTAAAFIASRRIDDGLDTLQPASLRATN